MSSLTLFVGMDVSQDTLEVAVRPTAETWQVANEAAGISALVAQLTTLAPALVVLEATGGFEGPVLAALAVAAVPVVRATPRQVRACAQAIGILAKTPGERLERGQVRGLGLVEPWLECADIALGHEGVKTAFEPVSLGQERVGLHETFQSVPFSLGQAPSRGWHDQRPHEDDLWKEWKCLTPG